jgi:hypothetical protein
MLAPGMFVIHSGVQGIAHWCDVSFMNALLRAALFSGVKADLWFHHSVRALMLFILSFSLMGLRSPDLLDPTFSLMIKCNACFLWYL